MVLDDPSWPIDQEINKTNLTLTSHLCADQLVANGMIEDKLSLAIVGALVGVMTLVVNGMVIWTVVSFQSAHKEGKAANKYLASLSICSIVEGLTQFIFVAVYIDKRIRMAYFCSRTFCLTMTTIMFIGFFYRLISMCIIAVDRRTFIFEPILHARFSTSKNVLRVIYFSWVVSIVCGTVVLYINTFSEVEWCQIFEIVPEFFRFYALGSLVLFCLFVNGLVFGQIGVLSKQMAQKTAEQKKSSERFKRQVAQMLPDQYISMTNSVAHQIHRLQRNTVRNTKFVKMFVGILVFLVVSWVPLFIMNEYGKLTGEAGEWVIISVYASAGLSSFILLHFNKELRATFYFNLFGPAWCPKQLRVVREFQYSHQNQDGKARRPAKRRAKAEEELQAMVQELCNMRKGSAEDTGLLQHLHHRWTRSSSVRLQGTVGLWQIGSSSTSDVSEQLLEAAPITDTLEASSSKQAVPITDILKASTLKLAEPFSNSLEASISKTVASTTHRLVSPPETSTNGQHLSPNEKGYTLRKYAYASLLMGMINHSKSEGAVLDMSDVKICDEPQKLHSKSDVTRQKSSFNQKVRKKENSLTDDKRPSKIWMRSTQDEMSPTVKEDSFCSVHEVGNFNLFTDIFVSTPDIPKMSISIPTFRTSAVDIRAKPSASLPALKPTDLSEIEPSAAQTRSGIQKQSAAQVMPQTIQGTEDLAALSPALTDRVQKKKLQQASTLTKMRDD